jgi:hypothetical protein
MKLAATAAIVLFARAAAPRFAIRDSGFGIRDSGYEDQG